MDSKTQGTEASRIMSYAKATQRKFPTLSFELRADVEQEDRAPPYQMVGEVLDKDLKLKREEVLKVNIFRERKIFIVKVATKEDILVSERFGEKVSFVREFKGTSWKINIIGGSGVKNHKIKILNVPNGVSNKEILDSLPPHVKPLGPIINEKYGKFHGPFLDGILNGHVSVKIATPEEVIPPFIKLDGKNVRIIHIGGEKRCFICQSGTHLAMGCVRNKKEEKTEMIMENSTQNEGDPNQSIELEVIDYLDEQEEENERSPDKKEEDTEDRLKMDVPSTLTCGMETLEENIKPAGTRSSARNVRKNKIADIKPVSKSNSKC